MLCTNNNALDRVLTKVQKISNVHWDRAHQVVPSQIENVFSRHVSQGNKGQ